jgi:Reverse transcriptase (RNA-dependent DNA polymerase)
MTWHDYEADLEPRIDDLHGRVHRGAYRPQPSRRTYIPKADGKQRPLAIAALEDKIQGATVMALNAIYEGDFCGFSIFEADFEDNAYGYRPRRSAVDAVKETHRLIRRGYTDVVDADLSKYFDTIPHSDLLKSVARRIVDRHVLHLIKMWLQAPPVEERPPRSGSRRCQPCGLGRRLYPRCLRTPSTLSPVQTPSSDVGYQRASVRLGLMNEAGGVVIAEKGEACGA